MKLNKKYMQGMSLWSLLFLLGSGVVIYKVATPPKNEAGEVTGQSPLDGMFNPAQEYQAILQIKELSKACELYMASEGNYPPSLDALISKPKGASGWSGPYMRGIKIPHDPWVQSYHYKYPGDNYAYDLYSLGPDEKPNVRGKGDDITNWEIQARSK